MITPRKFKLGKFLSELSPTGGRTLEQLQVVLELPEESNSEVEVDQVALRHIVAHWNDVI